MNPAFSEEKYCISALLHALLQTVGFSKANDKAYGILILISHRRHANCLQNKTHIQQYFKALSRNWLEDTRSMTLSEPTILQNHTVNDFSAGYAPPPEESILLGIKCFIDHFATAFYAFHSSLLRFLLKALQTLPKLFLFICIEVISYSSKIWLISIFHKIPAVSS